MIIAIIGVLLALTFLVVIHELGHFIAARRSGIAVKEFGIGFPPRVYGFRRGKTIYSINALPIGGFVSIKGEEGDEQGEDSYSSKPARVKLKVLLAGVTVNFLFAYVLLTVLFMVGVSDIFQFSLPNNRLTTTHNVGSAQVKILSVADGSAAQKAGIKVGDDVTTIGGTNVDSQARLRELTAQHSGESVQITYNRDGKPHETEAHLGTDEHSGRLGVVSMNEQRMRYSWWAAPIAAFIVCFKLIWATLTAFGGFVANFVTRGHVNDNVTGPIGITAAVPKIRQLGLDYLALLLAQISLSLAVVNILPISPLDGGKALLVVLKRIGISVNERFERYMQFAGFGFLLILMAAVTLSDIMRLR